jgi:hypothetical protein
MALVDFDALSRRTSVGVIGVLHSRLNLEA